MIDLLLEPFLYTYMLNAMWISAFIGGICAFLSCYLILKGWSLIGDALSHSIVPGVAGAYILEIPISIGAFFSGSLAAAIMLFFNQRTKLKEDTVIGLIFSFFFALGLFIISLSPISVNIQTIILGNVLAISDSDIIQLALISSLSLTALLLKWKDLMLIIFDEVHARSIGINSIRLKIIFFVLLSAVIIAALQTVGAFLVVCMIITPGATAYMFVNRFSQLLTTATFIGTLTGFFGTYISYFLDVTTGGIIVVSQTFLFMLAFFIAPHHGVIALRRRIKSVTSTI